MAGEITLNVVGMKIPEVGALRLTTVATADGKFLRALRVYGPAGYQEGMHKAEILLEADEAAKLVIPVEDFGV